MKKVYLTLSILISILSAETINVNVNVYDTEPYVKWTKRIQTDVPYNKKSELRKAYEKGGKTFRLYYEKRWYRPKEGYTFNQKFSLKQYSKEKAYKLLRYEDYTRYGCEEEAKYHNYKYNVDYFAILTSRYRTKTTYEECEIYIGSQRKNKNKKMIELF